MGFWTEDQIEEVNRIAAKSKELATPTKKQSGKASSITDTLAEMSARVIEYFKDSEAILIQSKEELHDYVTRAIETGYAGIDTETTGLDRIKDTIVGASLYYPGGVECYIPIRHLVPIFDEPYKNQLSYEDVGEEFQRLADSNIKLIFANADFDLSMIYKDMHVDLCDVCYYDVILAWRCLKENEKDNALKVLYNKYVLRGKGDPMKFSDFFTPQMFPYCKPEVAKLYAANDAKITYELFKWQLPYATKGHPKCEKANLSKLADLIWQVEMPLIKVCQHLHRTGMFVDKDVARKLMIRYKNRYNKELEKLADIVDGELEKSKTIPTFGKKAFTTGKEFNPNSNTHVKYLLYVVMALDKPNGTDSTGKEVLGELNLPVTNQILKVRSLDTLISTFVDKLPKSTTPDSRIHAEFKSIGADTGRFSSRNPNLQNIPSHAEDIRHIFRATPGYAIISSDYSAQEPRITAFVANEKSMIKAFQENRDVYASIASLSFNLPYERCLEHHPETGEYQADGYARRNEAKKILLGITYGRSVPSIAEQLFGKNKDMSEDEKVESAQKIYDAVLNAFPNIRAIMIATQKKARQYGYTETILGRRRHLPDMQLPEYDFVPLDGYVNPDVDPLDPSTLKNKDVIPDRIKQALQQEFRSFKSRGKVYKRMRELHDRYHIQVVDNRSKIARATRQCLNAVVQGSAADQSKLAMLKLESNEEWKAIGGRMLVPVHDEIIAEVPLEHVKRGGELLSSMMCEAADFLPFPSKCDVTTSIRWKGLEYPCQYPKPKSLTNLTEDEVKWVQYHLCECEYVLPVYKDENGEKPKGDASVGVNGVVSDGYLQCLAECKQELNATSDEDFIEKVENYVVNYIK